MSIAAKAVKESGIWDRIKNDSDSVNWCVIGYKKKRGKKKVLEVQGFGEGGLHEVRQALDPKKAQFAAFRVTAIDSSDTDGHDNQHTKRAQYVLVVWFGPELSQFKRAQYNSLVGAVKGALFMSGVSVAVIADSMEDVTDEQIVEALQSVSSFTVDHYDWGNGAKNGASKNLITKVKKVKEVKSTVSASRGDSSHTVRKSSIYLESRRKSAGPSTSADESMTSTQPESTSSAPARTASPTNVSVPETPSDSQVTDDHSRKDNINLEDALAVAQANNAALKSELDALKQTNAKAVDIAQTNAAEEISRLKEALAEAEVGNASLKTQLETLKVNPPAEPSNDTSEDEAIRRDLDAARTQIETLNSEASSHRAKISDLENAVEKAKQETADAYAKTEEALEQLKEAEAKIPNLTETAAPMVSTQDDEKDRKIDELSTALKKAEKCISDAESTATSEAAKVNDAQNALEAATEELESTKKELADAKAVNEIEVTKAEEARLALKQVTAELESLKAKEEQTSSEADANTISQLENDLTSANNHISELEKTLDTLNQEHKHLSETADANKETLEAAVATAQSKVEESNAKIAQLEAEIEKSKETVAEISAAKEAVKSIKDYSTGLETKLHELETQKIQVETELALLKEKFEQATESVDSVGNASTEIDYDPGCPKQLKVLYTFDGLGADSGTIQIKEDETATGYRKEGDDWWFGKNAEGLEGLFPANYVEE